MKGKFDGIESLTTYCPVCNETVTWYGLSKGFSAFQTISYASNHFFLTNDIAHSTNGYFGVPAGGVSCLYLNGHNLSNEAFITLQAKGTMNLLGNGTEIISGGGLNSSVYGCAIDIRGGIVNLYGVKVTKTPGTTRPGPAIGLSEAAGTLNVYAGSEVYGSTSTGNGGNIGMYYEGSTVNIYGGTVTGGKAAAGGNIFANGANYTVNISGGTVTGGTTTSGNGGNISVCGSKSAVNISGGTISNGTAANEGGNVYSDSNSTINVSGGTITGGQAKNGGSFSISNSHFKFTGGSISGGNATNMGGNLYFAVYATQYASITINNNDGGSAPTLSGGTATTNGGNIYAKIYTGKTLTIEDLNVSGGECPYGGNMLIEGAGALVMNDTTVTGGTGIDGAAATVGGSMYISSLSSATFTGCTFGSESAAAKAANGGTMYIGAPTTLNGCTVTKGTATGKGGNIYAGAALTINGSEISNGTAAGGGNIQMVSGATLTINKYGETKTTISGGNGGSGQGGNISCSGDTVIKNATISGGTTTTAWGGNIYIDSSKLTIGEGATVENGTGSAGGNLAAYVATLDIDDAAFIGGTANNTGTYAGGGSMYLWKCKVTADNTSFSGGNAGAKSGGSMYLRSNDNADFTGCTIEDGTATYGGNLYIEGAATFTDCTIDNGTANYGGNIRNNGTPTFTNCIIKNGNLTGGASDCGGNLDIRSACTFTGCTLEANKETKGTGTQFYSEAAVTLTNSTLTDGTIRSIAAITVTGGSHTGSILTAGDLSVDGAAMDIITITKGTATLAGAAQINNLDVAGAETKLVVNSDFSGEAKLYGLATKPASPIFGVTLHENYTATGEFTGKLFLSYLGDKPLVFHDNGRLVVANARTMKKVDGENVVTWHKNNATAIANYGDADALYPGDSELPLAGGTYVVNVCGLNLHVTGTGKVTFYDSANNGFTTYGTVTVDEGVEVLNEFATEVEAGGNTYYMIDEDGTLSFHRVALKINGVSIRPSVAGIYYTSTWQCDELMQKYIYRFGVAVSLKDQPDAGFVRDGDTLYSAFDKLDFESGKTTTSVLINNILVAGNEANAARGTAPIYATAYISFNDGENVVVDTANVSYSLKGAMELINNNPKVYLTNKTAVDNFYTKWESVMSGWELDNITGTPADPAEDETLNILMIGNSYCYYYVQELYDLLASDGINANVYNLYKSGCTLEEHYNWWKNDTAGYQFFWKTNEDGYNLVNSDKAYTTMAKSLLAENWDVITIQESLFKNLQSIDQGTYIAQARVYMDTLIPMLQKAFPNAEIYWHQQFGPEVGFQLGQNSVPDEAAQANYVAKAAYLANFAKETYGVKIVNTGDAWAAARANEELVAMLPYGGLCARKGENSFGDKRENAGDGYHDGDIGGGQYLNACVWYETLTGNSCVGKTFELKTYNNDKNSAAYAPYYELNADFVALLQEAAHSVPKN